MIDPQTTLAVSMVQKKGTHALMLGSGVSRSAHIPTGWEVVLHLIRQIAVAENEECGEDPAAWYTERFNAQPDYGDLLGQLADTQAGRGLIISSFIEPSEEERALGLKLPTPAHTAIARLVADGYIRVIVTTNFDRLLETALAEVGIVPTVIDSADAVLGSLPLVHNRCTIIKLHGDYVDSRIKNTTDELAEYDDPMVQLLRQVLREYGLIICGWSGEWDTALVAELNAAPQSPWFGSFWVSYREPREAAQLLIEARGAHLVTNMDADDFFQRLADSVQALADATPAETVSIAMARASVRRFIVEPSRQIQLHDLIVGEANRVRRQVLVDPWDFYTVFPTAEVITNRLLHYEQMTAVLRTLLIHGGYWGNEIHLQIWTTVIERLVDLPPVTGNIMLDWRNCVSIRPCWHSIASASRLSLGAATKRWQR